MRCILCLSLALALAPALRAADPVIKLASDKPGDPPVVVVELSREEIARLKAAKLTPEQWSRLFRVVVADGNPGDVATRPAVAGTYSLTDSTVRFEPQFPLVPGLRYRVVVHLDPKAAVVEVDLSIPKPPPGPRVSIAAVYPSANRLPENTLRFYLHFSGPVARGDVYRHLKLTRDDGVEVKEPFLELPEELWSADGNRLTVLFHPGRVKRGLVPREEDGPVLEEGRTYTLSISGKWEDTEGRPLVSGLTKTFTTGPPDDQSLDLAGWSMMAPRAGSDAPLIVRLAKPLDHALLGRWVWVVDARGKRVPGTLTVGGGERVLTFAPESPWAKGEYRLVADTRLEDVCGNSVGQPFEVDEFRPVTPRIESKTAERPFSVR